MSTEQTSRFRLALYLFLTTATFGFLQPFVSLYMVSAHLSKGQVGLATGIGTGLALLIQPALGKLSDRVDARRPFICVSALVSLGAFMAFPYASGLVAFSLLFALGTNGTTYLQAAGAALAGRLVSGPGGGSVYASLRLWGSVGYIVVSLCSGMALNLLHPGPLGRSELNDVFTWGPIIFLAIAILAWWLPDRRNRDEVAVAAKLDRPSANLKRFLFAYFLYSIALYGAISFLGIYIKSLGGNGLWITGTFAAGVIIEVLVMRRSGAFSDKYGRRPALAVSFCLLPLRMFLYAPATGPGWVLAVQSMHGINFGIVGAVAVAFANDLAGEGAHGRAQARLFAASGLASAVGPILLGVISDRFGMPAMFAVSGFVAMAGAAVLVLTVDDSHPHSVSLAERMPSWLRPYVSWLDAPPKWFGRASVE